MLSFTNRQLLPGSLLSLQLHARSTKATIH